MQWPLRQFIEILVLAFMGRVRAGTWEAGMGWMRVDQNGLAVPMEHQEDCEEHDWMGIPPPPNISMIKYNSKMVEGMNCDFERPDECQWKIVPNKIVRKFGEDGLVRIEAHEKNYGKNKDGTYRRRNRGHYLIFQANYKNAANTDCSPSFSHIESPWIEQSLPECILQFNFTTTVHPDDYQETNEHAYMEVTLSDKSHGVIPLPPCLDCTNPDDDKRNPWGILQYKIGKWNKFKFDIAFFRGVNESKKSYFAIDDIQLINCLESPSSLPQQCNDQKELKCNRTGKCYSKTMDLCDFHNDCKDKDDEENPICAQMDDMGSQYRCNFSNGDCDWTTSGKMRWSLMQEIGDDGTTNYMDMNMAEYFNKDLVTVGMLRSPEMPPPPLYNDDDNSKETFQSCTMRLYLRVEGPVLNVDMFEIEVVENIPFTKVSRGNRVKKKEMIKIKDFLRDNGLNNGENKYKTGHNIEMTEWTKIELVIPTGMKYRYFIQLSAIKSPDISGRQEYRLGVKDISFSPQCLGLAVPENKTSGCKKQDMEWRHDMDLKELAYCMDVPFPEEQTIGLDSFIFNSCGTNVGQYGPYKEECISYYESLGGNNTEVDMLDLATITSMDEENPVDNETYLGLRMKSPPIGIQKWVAPDTGIFTVIAKGASGGHGRLSRKSSHGAIIKAIIKLKRGDILFILVGQEGESACVIDGVETREGLCSQMGIDDYRAKRWVNGKETEGRTQGHPDKLFNRKEKKKKRKSRRNKIFRNSANLNGNGPMEAIHLINKLNQLPEKMLADESKAFEPRSQYTRNEEDEQDSQSSYSPYSSDSDNVTVNEYPETCTGEDCKDWMVKIKDFRPSYQGGGGGGGGGTFIFKVDRKNPSKLIPVIIAGGGGGMADISSDNNPDAITIFDDEKMKLSEVVPDFDNSGITAETRHEVTQGGHGGGWNDSTLIDKVSQYNTQDTLEQTSAGGSQHESWLGGLPCNYKDHEGQGRDFYEARWGGFGGGGGGCNGGGGGGGFIGGKGGINGSENGEGGWSFVDKNFVIWHTITSGEHAGPGEVFIIPDISNNKNQSQCKCHDSDSLCLALSEDVADVNCYCSSGHLVDVNIPCNEEIPVIFVIILVIGCIVLAAIIGLLCMCLYTQYQRKRMGMLRNKLQGANRFRNSNGIMMTEYNPNYEFAGGSCSLQDLREVERENLMLVKALGQGAFGEVYQGIFKNKTDSTETAVAVKTLPELSTNQAEMDFLMEALIMSKFVHPNIVHFIGVCFDKHPRFIILELLAGGDLKTFLRESRSKPDKPSSLTMRDLLNAAIDVAKGCSYLEENHFIHRDIAARNCLLTSKGPDRVVKIADFGMARDIYRADYYRKGGKAMLPVKWMPPEAFLDGIFTAKTDIWSFGILLWEVMSLGYMPYPGRANQEVMQLVTNGGRLEPPNYCPGPLYGLMCQCWHPIPEERPTFTTILERLGYCLQDPEVVMAPLPVFHRPQSITSHDTSLSSLRTGDCNSSGNSGSGGSVSIGRNASFKNNHSHSQPPTSDYLVPNLTSVSNLTTSPCTDDGLDTQSFGNDTETSFTNPNSSSSITRGAYTRVPTEPPTSTSLHSQCKTVNSRWNPQEFPNEGVQESKSTEPLLPSPTSGSLDLTNIPPPCLYTDPVLPLNPARLTPSSYANVSRGPSIPHPVPGSVCDQRASLYAVSNRPYDSNNTRVESKTYPSSEISV